MRSNYRFTDPNYYSVDLDDELTLKDTWLDGNLYVWGRQRTEGGTTFTVLFPIPIDTDYSWRSVAVGSEHVIALKTDGTLWSWGANQNGQLGLGDTVNRATPVQVGREVDWSYITSAGAHSGAIRRDGTLWLWGENGSGNLGIGDRVHRSSPVQLGSRTDWKTAHFGISSSAVIDNVGNLWVWGSNFLDTIGLGDRADRSSPVQLGSGRSWRQVVFEIYHGRAIDREGTLWAWGRNNNGQIGVGDPTATDYVTPVQVGTEYDWRYVSGAHAIKSNGTLWAWGDNTNGQLGLGDLIPRSSPTQVGSLTNWKQIKSSQNSFFGFATAVKTDGSLWVWGTNSQGCLGLDDSVHRSSPVQIGSATNWKIAAEGSLVFTNAAILDITNY